MDTPAIAVIVIGALWIIAADVFKHRKRRSSTAAVVGRVVRVERMSVFGVLWGLIQGSLLFAGFIVVGALYLRTYPLFWVDWWMLVLLIDLAVFAVCLVWKMPRGYRRYMQEKPANQHTALDYLVGALSCVVMLGGVGVHLLTVAQAPGWSLSP